MPAGKKCQPKTIPAIARLDEIAARVKELHSDLKGLVSRTFAIAKEMGELLAEAKAKIDGGRWTHWLSAQCDLVPGTANRYIVIANNWDKVTHHDMFPKLNVKQAFNVARGKPPGEKRTERLGLQTLDVLLDLLDMRLSEYVNRHPEIEAIIEAIDNARPTMEELGLLNSQVEARKKKIRDSRRAAVA